MKLLSWFFFGALSIFCAVAFSIVTGVFHPAEKVNALWLVVASASFYVLAMRFYGRFLCRRVVRLDDRRTTPSYRLRDDNNFQPTNPWVLFGHHFAAIAGAGPLLGPVLAAQFGYLPGFLWLVIGAVLAGSVQDFIILVASMRRDGRSLPQIAREEIGELSGTATLIAVLFVLVVALAGLGLAVVNALDHNPWGTFTLAATIPIALYMGLHLQKFRPGHVGEVTLIGVVLLVAAVLTGQRVPGSALSAYFDLDRPALIFLLAGYGFLASVLPVWMLLVPRDYLSTFMKVGVIGMLGIGVIVMAPTLLMPPLTGFIHGGGPVIPGTLFPFVFITIACGAISGFHSLVSSGTTPKMIACESHALIGYGAMLTESFVGVMSLVAASILTPGDYLAINTRLAPETLASIGYPIRHIDGLSQLVGINVAGRPGGAVSLAVGIASIFSSLPGMRVLMAYWYQFALLFEALFILTTIDAGTRIARYLVQEIGGHLYAPLQEINWMPGVLMTSLVVVLAWGTFLYHGSVSTVWPMFGAANQLLGTLALCVGTTILIKTGKARFMWVTVLPMLFVGTVTLAGSWELLFMFLALASRASSLSEAFSFYLNAGLVGAVALLAVVILCDSAVKWYGYLFLQIPMITTEYNPDLKDPVVGSG